MQRRLAGEPLAYLTGHKEFFGLDLQVDARVLVPRPDTETLVNWALELLEDQQRVLDLGTGSGAIALALKASKPALHVHATDFSAEALAVAQANAQRLKLDVSFHQGAWFAALPASEPRFDCIVANPPYIAELDSHLAALKFEPAQALTSGPTGWTTFATSSPRPQGTWHRAAGCCWNTATIRHRPCAILLTAAGFAQVQSRQDLAGIERCSGGQFNPTPQHHPDHDQPH